MLKVLFALATLRNDPHELRDTLVLRCRTAVWTDESVVRVLVVDVPMQFLIACHKANRGASPYLPLSFRKEVPAV